MEGVEVKTEANGQDEMERLQQIEGAQLSLDFRSRSRSALFLKVLSEV